MPLQLSKSQEKKLGKLLVRGFTKKQLVVLESISKDKSKSITSAAKKISEERKIPLSTVKLDLKILERLEIIKKIEKQGLKKALMSRFGKLILQIISDYNDTRKNLEYLLSDKLLYLFKQIIKVET